MPKTSPTVLLRLTMLILASGMCYSLWSIKFSVYASHVPLYLAEVFALAAVSAAYNALPGVQHSIRVVGQTLRVQFFELFRQRLSP